MKRRALLSMTAALPLVACAGFGVSAPQSQRTEGPTPGPHTGLFVDADFVYGPISARVYGSNTGPWQTIGFDQRALLPELGISMIRWPGGNWGDENDPTELMIDEYLALCSAAGCEPTIHVRLFGGTPEKAAQMVRYVNVTKKAGVRYWAIGNEPDLFVKKRGAKAYAVADYARDFVAYREAMRAVDPTLVVLGPELSQFGPDDGYPRDATGAYWLRGFLERVPDVEIVSLHRYPFGQSSVSKRQLADEPERWTASIAYVRSVMRSVLGKELPIAVTEANSDWSGRVDEETGTNSWRNGLWWAAVLSRLIAADVVMVHQFCLGAISGQGIGLFGPVSYNSGPLPIAEVYRMFHLFGQTRIHADHGATGLHMVAARRDDGALTVVVVNTQAREVTVPFSIANGDHKQAQVWRFGVDTRFAEVGQYNLADPLTVPAETASLFVFGAS